MQLEISLAPERLFNIGDFAVTNSFLVTLSSSLVLVVCAIILNRRLAMIPRGLQNVCEVLIEGGWNFIDGILNDKEKTKKVFPLVFTMFIFILFSNLLNFLPLMAFGVEEGHRMVPVFRGAMADYGMVLVLTLLAVISVQVAGVMACGPAGYLAKFFNLRNPLMFFVGILEFIGEFTRVLSLSFRLFGNIFAGEVLMSVMLFLAPFVVPLPFMALELMAAVIQAFVFSILTVVFIKMATEHEEEGVNELSEIK